MLENAQLQVVKAARDRLEREAHDGRVQELVGSVTGEMDTLIAQSKQLETRAVASAKQVRNRPSLAALGRRLCVSP